MWRRFSCKLLQISRKMSVFVHRNNPVTGKSEWELVREDYDFHQEVARAGYGDMLHDKARNQLYYAGLKAAIELKHAAGEEANVLDIGTGTGLLSMMAATCGADSIVACEAFEPMARCAREVIKLNGFADRIHVVGKRSTEMILGEDLPKRANILVTEVFDTELIGEGAVGTFSHAHQHLLEPGCLVVPSSATVYAQLVEGDLFSKWTRLDPILDKNDSPIIKIPPEMKSCRGSSVVHDVQLSEFQNSEFQALTDPIPVIDFDWSNPNIPKNRNVPNIIVPKKSGKAYALFMWWDLKMDPLGEIILSCAPSWTGNKDWRDHWIQAIYYLPQEIEVTEGQELTLHTCHDEFSFWFYTSEPGQESKKFDLPSCTCGLHLAATFTRLGNLNDKERRSKFLTALSRKVDGNTKALVSSDGTLLASLVKKLGAEHVCTTDEAAWSQQLAKFNDLSLDVIHKDALNEDFTKTLTLLCSEPNYDTAILPWYNLAFWYLRSELTLNPDVTVMPRGATIWALPVELEHLWKIRAPLGDVEGFLMKPFDDLIESSSDISDCTVEPQPLWEYTNTSLGDPQSVIEFDFSKPVAGKISRQGSINISSVGICHAVCLWMDWHLDETTTISTGPTSKPTPGLKVDWDKHTRQGIYLIRPYKSCSAGQTIDFSAVFLPDSGHIDFKFEMKN